MELQYAVTKVSKQQQQNEYIHNERYLEYGFKREIFEVKIITRNYFNV